jgi:hypothetical protein
MQRYKYNFMMPALLHNLTSDVYWTILQQEGKYNLDMAR